MTAPATTAEATTGPAVGDYEVSVDGAALLDELLGLLRRYVVFPSPQAAVAVTLWIAATHVQGAWQHAPRLVIRSPEKRCGKSRLLDVVEATCHQPLISVNATVAAIVRSLGGEEPRTLLIDEADALWGTKRAAEGNEDLRAILNAGFQRNRPVTRCVGPAQTPTEFDTFAMAALAGIGDLPDTIADRAVIITLRRRAPGETVTPYRRRRDQTALTSIRDQARAWLQPHESALAVAEPPMPVEDRAADTWEPLVAIADLAGGHWPDLARHAATTLTTAAQEDAADIDHATRLLADLRGIFGDRDAMHTSELLNRLKGIHDSPWMDMPDGRAINAHTLSRMLRPYGARPKDIKIHGDTRKGYRREHLADAWTRYLAPIGPNSATTATSPTQQGKPGSGPVAGSGSNRNPATPIPAPDQPGSGGSGDNAAPADPICQTCGWPPDSVGHDTQCQAAA